MVRKPIMPVRGMRGELTRLPPFASHLPFSPPWLSQIKLSKSVEKVRGYYILTCQQTKSNSFEEPINSAAKRASRLPSPLLDRFSGCPSNLLGEFIIYIEADRQELVQQRTDRRYELLSLSPKQYAQCPHHTHTQTRCRTPS